MKSQLEDILKKVYAKRLSPEEALKALRDFPYQDLGFAKIDHHRNIRKGFPEIIYGLGKTHEQILRIGREIVKKGSSLLITKVEGATFKKIKRAIPQAAYNPQAKTIYLKQRPPG